MKKYKIVKTELFKKQEKKLPKKVKKELDKTLDKLKENPYIGKICSKEETFEVHCIMIEQEYEITQEEVVSMILSNVDYFKDLMNLLSDNNSKRKVGKWEV